MVFAPEEKRFNDKDRKMVMTLAEIGMKVNPNHDSIYINGKELKSKSSISTIFLISLKMS